MMLNNTRTKVGVCCPADVTEPESTQLVRYNALEQLGPDEKPRQKLLHRGVQALDDVELLAAWLGTGTRSCGVLELSREILSVHGSIKHLLHAERQKFCSISGLGDTRFVQLKAMVELCRRAVYETLEHGSVLSSPGKVREYLALQLGGIQQELFAALFLDNRHRVICYRELFIGTIDGAAVYPREVVKDCLSVNAAAVIFAHNHPSGVAEPSDADINITAKLKNALDLIDVRVLDHLIVGDGVQTSLAERGLV